MREQKAAQMRSRSPRGCNAQPIALALRPTERDELEAIAELEMRSLAATSRMLCLKGLEAYKAETVAAQGGMQ